MVMADRPEVRTASKPVAVIDLVGLAQQLANSLVRVPFRSPLSGPSGRMNNLGQSVTREVLRTFMGYSSSLPIEEFRSIEMTIDMISKLVLSPVVALEGVDSSDAVIAGVPGIWYRPKQADPIARILYLHGGGYVGTSPNMYAFFTARLAAATHCEVFVADYRLAPEFPFPAGLTDAVGIIEEWIAEGSDRRTIFVAGDSGGGGLATSLVYENQARALPSLGGLLLFSPEVDLALDTPSITENADKDILPWNIPTSAYLHGEAATDAAVSALDQNVSRWPPVYLTWGADEMFRDSIRMLAQHLEAAEVPLVSFEARGMFHVYPILMPWADASHQVFGEAEEFVRTRVTAVPTKPGRASRRRPAAPRSGRGGPTY
jgi:monoterpene epsilon-lactone hydrolase